PISGQNSFRMEAAGRLPGGTPNGSMSVLNRIVVRSFEMNDLEKALSLLTHGPECRFLDRLTVLDGGKSGRGEYRIRGDEPFLRGHFPGVPIFPGVLLAEAAAQLAGVVVQSDPAVAPLKNLKLTALRNAKILGAARPGDVLE